MSHGLKRIAVLGEIGSGNLGDDYGYVLVRNELQRAFDELDILTDIRPLTPNLHGLLAGYHWDAVVTGCGTLLDQANGVHVRALRGMAGKCPVAVLGSGVSDARYIPPSAEGRAEFCELVYRQARHVWLRSAPAGYDDEFSAPDPMWLHGWHGEGSHDLVGINVGYAGYSTINLDPAFLSTVKVVRDILSRQSVLIAAWHNDHPWLSRVARPGENIETVTGTADSLKLLNRCHAVLATRIHLAVLAVCHGAKAVLPDYADKVTGVWAGTGAPWTCLTHDSDAGQVASALHSSGRSARRAVEAAQVKCQERMRRAAKSIAEAW